MNKVLIVASGLSAKQFDEFDYKEEEGWNIVVVNNAWMATEGKWDHWVKAKDFAGKHPNVKPEQVVCNDYKHVLMEYGGHVKCGYSITLVGGYYALKTFDPDVIGFLGADMNYTPNKDGSTHVYGVGYDIKQSGVPDPDRMAEFHGRNDPKKYLTDIYMRFLRVAKERHGCDVVNFSKDEKTRLPYPKSKPEVW